MPPSKLTKIAFNIADIVCWLMLVLTIGTLVVVFFPPYMNTWAIKGLPINLVIILEVVNTLINGLGYYLLIKRKPFGFFFIVATSAIDLIATMYFHVYTVYYLLVLLAIVSAPWVLVSREIVNASTKET
jgi:hypothetical protein